jgi:uncharacterized membrane protein YesL
MFGFVIKKWFFDLWDNFLPVVLVNLGFIAVVALPVSVPPALAQVSPVAGVLSLIVGVFLAFIYAGAAFAFAGSIADYESLSWSSFFAPLKQWFPASLALAAIAVAHIALLAVALPVYSAMDNFIGLFAIAALFWMSVIWWLAAQFYWPVRGRLNRRVGRVLKKSFLLTFDNVGFSTAIAAGGLVVTAISFFTALLIPGIVGLGLWYQTAVKLRLYKYDYLEEHPDASRRNIPWDALLFDDRERVGKRSLKGMIFPWKD